METGFEIRLPDVVRGVRIIKLFPYYVRDNFSSVLDNITLINLVEDFKNLIGTTKYVHFLNEYNNKWCVAEILYNDITLCKCIAVIDKTNLEINNE